MERSVLGEFSVCAQSPANDWSGVNEERHRPAETRAQREISLEVFPPTVQSARSQLPVHTLPHSGTVRRIREQKVQPGVSLSACHVDALDGSFTELTSVRAWLQNWQRWSKETN